MLDYQILNHKKIINKNGFQYIDLMTKTLNDNIGIIGGPLIVNKFYVARPDLISLACYGDDKYADIICKVNGISNPFEMNENDILIIPSMDYIDNCILSTNKASELVDDDNEFLKENSLQQKEATDRRSPNEQIIGDNNFIIDHSNGLVFY